MKTETYQIHDSQTGDFIREIECDFIEMEKFSSDSAEGHFRANRCDKLEDLGTQSVYAILT